MGATLVLRYTKHITRVNIMAKEDKTTPPEPRAPFVIPEGITMLSCIGPLSGKPLFKVKDFEMPYQGSEEDAISLYQRLKHAYETGYYSGSHAKKN